ncbi:GNAT family N-acetyltransferase [Maioricimonas sp. JC845]|uniref:GNAT family N-acetyltransferase n=1 Tax=Maioricimonas sp. JC845 TaxID=3232138 RepID=UPI00345A8E9B
MFEYQIALQEDEATRFRDVLFQTLNIPHERWDEVRENIGWENLRGLRHDGRLIGGMGLHQAGQWFGGRCVPCCCVTLVGIAPEYRRKGAARTLMTASLRELRETGIPIASLYASTQALYRAVGFEQAGTRNQHELPMSMIGVESRELDVHEVDEPVAEPFQDLCTQRARLTNGNLERTAGLWNRVLKDPKAPVHRYLIGDRERPEGFVVFTQECEQRFPLTLSIRDMWAASPAAGRRLWTFLADHASVGEKVRWFGPANDPLLGLTAECKFTDVQVLRWLVRIVDVKQALEQRGYPPAVSGELHLSIQDDVLPENEGRYVLEVADGRGTVREGGRGDLACHVRGLAPLFAGFFPPQTLAGMGWIEGTAEAVQAATALFAGPEPWMPEIF